MTDPDLPTPPPPPDSSSSEAASPQSAHTAPERPPGAAASPPWEEADSEATAGHPPLLARPRRDPWPFLFAFLLSALVLGIVYVWVSIWHVAPTPEGAPGQASAALEASQIAALGSQLSALDNRVQTLENQLKTLPAPADLAPLSARLEALGAQQARLEAAQQQNGGAADSAARLAQDETRLEALAQTVGTLTRQLADLSDRDKLFGRLQAAEFALADGRPLGDLPGAPAALARFATVSPPTEASLRRDFPAAAAARAAVAGAPAAALSSRLRDLFGQFLTVRRGDQVLLGDPLAARLALAQSALDAGDVEGALAALAPIEGAPAVALAPWKDKAEELVAARQALADLARAR